MKISRLATIVASGVAGMTMAFAAHAADYTLSVNTALATSDPLYKGLEAFVKNVDERTKGQIKVTLFPNSQLGPDEDVLEQARAGAPVAVIVDGGRLAVFEKEFGILGAPYLAQGYDGIRKVVTSDLFETWVQKLRKASGHQVLSFNWWQGERHLLTKKPITKPADLNGLVLRTPGAPVWTETVKAMGGTPTPMPFSDVYSALQLGTIDGTEAQLPAVVGANLQEVITHITKTGHINLITGLVTSAAWFDSLPEDLQKILREESLKAGDIASYGTRDALASIEQKLKDGGVEVTDIDTTPFKEATKVVYDKLGYGDLHKQVDELLNK
ncbi:C4-dicarboxylate TRAP transporter substrate-binding protein [Thalassospira marina]|uniref:C4-dicarboxylate ABC transporter n=1 Tax=Thalassospira marina TaxID=2048283 RepID=A0ABN5FUH4_9PROT|nr:C4-dicarboxylate TRAP transporter substrate-binding protein [Thalassospira marina]AUG55495.1 C4-dicarboxylate ABC transporter [Thalassospira marina]